MKLSNLHAQPDKYQDTISLIEKCFGYKAPNKFDVDFYPLMKPGNRENCWIIEDDEKVVAHSAALEKSFKVNGVEFPVLFIGGVAVHEDYRGKGLSSRLLEHIFQAYPQQALFILWSEKVEMYRKYGFYPCVELFEHPQTSGHNSFTRTKLAKLSTTELAAVRELYKSAGEIRTQRSDQDWKDLAHITSSDLFIKKVGDVVTNYFFINKGQDLTGVIHEYGDLKEIDEIRHYGKLWSTHFQEDSQALFGSLFKIGDKIKFQELIKQATGIKIKSLNGSVDFEFQGSQHRIEVEDFLQGAFGPGRFQELDALPKFFISGLDSI